MRWVLLILVLAAAAGPARAEEFYALGGVMQNANSTNDSSYSWQLEYLEGVGEHFAATLSYLNEGHVPVHHRDGNTVQLWTRTNVLDRRLSLAAGGGPYYYFDTTAAKAGGSYADNHGWGGMLSLAATWYTESRWLFQLRSNWVWTGDSIDTFSTLAGVGYQLDAPLSPGPIAEESPQRNKTTSNELTLFVGRTVVNSFSSEHALAMGVEYRRGLWRNVDWTVSWLNEGDSRLVRRNGICTQLWAVRAFFDDRLALGVGAGAYITIDNYNKTPTPANEGDELLSGITTLTASYRIDPHWALRASWNRIVTNYDRDTDVLLGGIGYRF
jgi:hypothetical protein